MPRADASFMYNILAGLVLLTQQGVCVRTGRDTSTAWGTLCPRCQIDLVLAFAVCNVQLLPPMADACVHVQGSWPMCIVHCARW